MSDGGVRYWLKSSPPDFSRHLFAPLPRKYDALAFLLSFGQDKRWRTAMVRSLDTSGAEKILDVACGPGAVTTLLARSTSADIVGVDLSFDMIRKGLSNVVDLNLSSRVAMVVARGQHLPFADEQFDALSFTYLLRYVTDPFQTLAELVRVVRPGGSIASLEFSVPDNPLARVSWYCYTRAVLPVLGFIFGGRAWWTVGRFLGPSITNHYQRQPVAQLIEDWRRAGVTDVQWRRMSLGGAIIIWGHRTP